MEGSRRCAWLHKSARQTCCSTSTTGGGEHFTRLARYELRLAAVLDGMHFVYALGCAWLHRSARLTCYKNIYNRRWHAMYSFGKVRNALGSSGMHLSVPPDLLWPDLWSLLVCRCVLGIHKVLSCKELVDM